MFPTKPRLLIVSPALASANNGNWHTARRWQQLLAPSADVRIADSWPAPPDNTVPAIEAATDQAAWQPDALIALHARRSAPSIRRWREQRGAAPLLLVLTGTDLYHDLPGDAEARASLATANLLVTLQEAALSRLEGPDQSRCLVIEQSATPLPERVKASNRLDCTLVGHLRAEKDPLTALTAWQYLPPELPIHLHLIGRPLDASLAIQIENRLAEDPRLKWTPGLAHEQARIAMAESHLLLVSSRIEGGANVIAEALQCGTPVLASDIDGNRGMLGPAYPGYFPAGDARALATQLVDCLHSLASAGGSHAQLQAAASARRQRFAPAREAALLQTALKRLLQ